MTQDRRRNNISLQHLFGLITGLYAKEIMETSTRLLPSKNIAAIAQLGERQTEDLKVPGSIPGRGSSFLLHLFTDEQKASMPLRLPQIRT